MTQDMTVTTLTSTGTDEKEMNHMARIIYGIQSDGLGHYGRSKAVIDYLISRGHKVKVLTAEKAYQFMKDKYDVENIERIFFIYRNNRVDYLKTAMKATIRIGKILRQGYFKTRRIVKKFKPDVIISDFEIFTTRVAYDLKIPLISVDNIHSITHTYARRVVDEKFKRFEVEQKIGVTTMVPNADHFFVTSFFDCPVTDEDSVTIVPSLVRKEIIDMKKRIEKRKATEKKRKSKRSGEDRNEFTLVYQTSSTNKRLVPELNKIKDKRFIVYGFNIDKTVGNCTLKKHSTDGFLKDLEESRAIVSNGGFTLISEAIFLHKPVLSNPIECQYEQILNATYVEKLGYGIFAEKITAKNVKKFLSNLKQYEKNLEGYRQKDNSLAFRSIEKKILELKNPNRKRRTFKEKIRNILERVKIRRRSKSRKR